MSEKITIGQADALIVVDVQNDFCPGGALAVPNGDVVVAPVNALMSVFDHVILTQDWHPAGHSSFASSHPGKPPLTRLKSPAGCRCFGLITAYQARGVRSFIPIWILPNPN